MGHPSNSERFVVSRRIGEDLEVDRFVVRLDGPVKAEEMDGCPTFAPAYVGRK